MEVADPINAKGNHHEGCGQRAVCGRPYPPRPKACHNHLSQEIEDPSPDPESVPVTPSPEPRPIPVPCFRCTASSSECSLEVFTECLITAGAPEAFFDDCWDEKVSENVAGPSRLQ